MWEYIYCSRECYVKSEFYIRLKFVFRKIYSKMKGDSLHEDLIDLLDRVAIDESIANYEIPEWICELEGVD